MILIFGGTTEGRIAIDTLTEGGKPFYYSTRGALQEIDNPLAKRLVGAMDAPSIVDFCQREAIRLIIDAAHPFAEQLHQNIGTASLQLKIPVLRLERSYPLHSPDITYCDSYAEAIDKMLQDGVQHLLALTGTQTIGKLRPFWEQRPTTFRILEREDSRAIAHREGFPLDRLIYYTPELGEDAPIAQLRPDAVITKESGTSGGFIEKIEAAQRAHLAVYVVKRPSLPSHFISVEGQHNLYRMIRHYLPDYYPLKRGYTTGTCATVTAKAALMAILEDVETMEVEVALPRGERITLVLEEIERLAPNKARASIKKDAGDDPDVIHGHLIETTVELVPGNEIRFLHGRGVGTVTLPGLGIPIGEPAINATPRETITQELRSLYPKGGIAVTISIPDGEALASKTFNPKLGIVGGLSIIGTSGIVKPFSHEAFVNSLRKECNVAFALSPKHLVINSGAKSEAYIKKIYPFLPSQAFVHYGNYIGDALQIAQECGFARVSMGIMIGKAVKLAEGNLDTHSKKIVMNRDFLHLVGREEKVSPATHDLMDKLTLARELWSIPNLKERNGLLLGFLRHCHQVAQTQLTAPLTLHLISEEGKEILTYPSLSNEEKG